MSGKKLAVFLLLILVIEMTLFPETDAGRRRRRRRRRYRRPPPPTTKPPPSCDSSIPFPSVIWHNKWKTSFGAECPMAKGYLLSQWFSIYRECQKDRIFNFKCRRSRKEDVIGCHWTSKSAVEEDVNFQCPYNGFITGMRLFFDKASSDRRVSFKCCITSQFKHGHCGVTPYMNTFGGLLNYVVPCGYRLVGISNNYSSSNSDRRWRFTICKK